MNLRILTVLLICHAAVGTGCSAILGKDDTAEQVQTSTQVRFQYVETLRDQESLRGESLRDTKVYDDAVKAAGALQRPSAVAADPFRVYVTDSLPSGRLAIFDRGLRTMVSLTAPAVPAPMAEARYVEPAAVALDEAGYVYVADPGQARIFGLDRDGGLLFTLGKTGDMSYPIALAVDQKRARLYVADRDARVVRVYAFRGELLYTISGSGKKDDLRRPVGIALDRDGLCYVLDGSYQQRVFVYATNGMKLKDFPISLAKDPVARRLAGIAVDSDRRVYISDQLNNVILLFDQDGMFLQQWGGMGSRRDEFWGPTGIFIDQQDTIYIADQMNGRIQVFQRAK